MTLGRKTQQDLSMTKIFLYSPCFLLSKYVCQVPVWVLRDQKGGFPLVLAFWEKEDTNACSQNPRTGRTQSGC